MPGGWHADPWLRFQLRYHDGQNWTDNVSSDGDWSLDSAWQKGVAPLPPTVKRSRTRALGQILASLAFLAALLYFKPFSTSEGGQRPAMPPPSLDLDREVFYFVEGTARSADITYSTLSGISQQSGVDVPLNRKDGSGPGLRLGLVPSGTFVSISAQNKGDSGAITCRIEAAGRVISQSTSRGAYVIASCDGTVV